MPPILIGQEDFEGDFNILKPMNKKTELENSSNIRDYNKFPLGRVNADLKNQLGEVEHNTEMSENDISDKKPNINARDESIDTTKIDSVPDYRDARDLDGDGKVSYSEAIQSAGANAYEVGKAVVSSASTTITSGIDKSISGAKKVALSVCDVNNDGKCDIHDLGAGFVGAGQNFRSATGIDEVASGLKESQQQATQQLIFVGGAIVLAYLLIKY